MCVCARTRAHDRQSVCVCVCALCTGSAPFTWHYSALNSINECARNNYCIFAFALALTHLLPFCHSLFCALVTPHLISSVFFRSIYFGYTQITEKLELQMDDNEHEIECDRDTLQQQCKKSTYAYTQRALIALVLMACVCVCRMLYYWCTIVFNFGSNVEFLFEFYRAICVYSALFA